MDRDSNIKNVIEKLDGFYESLSKGERMKFDISYLRKANVYLADLKKENETLVKQLCEKEDMIREAEGRFYELQKQLSEKQPEWISVEDEPPTEPGRILINRKNSTRVNTYSYQGNKKELKNFAYWMPMPKAPEPPKPTFRDVFLKAFPKAVVLEHSGVPRVCAKEVFPQLGDDESPRDMRCSVCWNQPYFEEEEKE